jgi:hypothetical protein
VVRSGSTESEIETQYSVTDERFNDNTESESDNLFRPIVDCLNGSIDACHPLPPVFNTARFVRATMRNPALHSSLRRWSVLEPAGG